MAETLLEIRNLNKTLGGRKIINNLSFSVKAGEVFGFLGPNGAGKTTTIKMVMGFLFPDSGDIIIDSINLKDNYEKAMGKLGGIVENPEMYKYLTGRQNLEMYARIHDGVSPERIDEVLELVGMTGRADEKLKKYSLGMKQRIGVAQALVHRPKVLILDEPTNGLDPVGIKELRDILKHLAHEENIAVMVSSHMLSEMQLMCDRVGIISNGNLIGLKPIDELIEMNGKNEYLYSFKENSEKAKEMFAEKFPEHTAEIENGMLKIAAKEEEIPEINRFFIENGLDFYSLERSGASLEEAFINITGGGMDIA